MVKKFWVTGSEGEGDGRAVMGDDSGLLATIVHL